MDVPEIERRVVEIARVAEDDERAHGMEDDLHQDVLASIANDNHSAKNCKRLAAAALKTKSIEFGRWAS
jgi:hypothetical protein